MFRREMGVSHDHLERSMPEQLRHGAQVYSGHYESTGKSMAVAMPGIPLDLRLFERRRKPAARALQCFPAPGGRKDRGHSRRRDLTPHLFQSCQRDRVQGNGARVFVLGFRQMNLAALEAHLIPAHAVLLAHSHPGVNGKQQMRQKFRKAALDHGPQSGLFRIRQKSYPPRALRLAPDARRRVAVDLLIVDAHSKDQRTKPGLGRAAILPAIWGATVRKSSSTNPPERNWPNRVGPAS